jgi:hypothetical protein
MCQICRNEDLSNVETLRINNCQSLFTIPELPSLKNLNIQNCNKLVNIECINLVNLCVFRCKIIKIIPSMNELEILDIDSLTNLESIQHMPTLKTIYLRKCKLVKTIPEINSLEKLTLIDSPTYSYYTIDKKPFESTFIIPSLPNLTLLDIQWYDIKYIPQFKKLSKLIIRDCNIKEILSMDTLLQLELNMCPHIKSLPEFECLQSLIIYGSPLLTTIPFYPLTVFHVENCKNIQYLPFYYLKIGKSYNNLKFTRSNKKLGYNCKLFVISSNVVKLYDNIANIIIKYKLRKYINHINQYIYSNPSLPYMKYYIENSIYEKQTAQTRVGFINSKNKLIWLDFK